MFRSSLPLFGFWFLVADLVLLALAWPFRNAGKQPSKCVNNCGRDAVPGFRRCEEWYAGRK